ncbi:MAG: toll/interleukin-1 receptor domain-containing protein [Clostridia bacterium]|nr:toll/interleukin-1 receptor domain-containing protein [Clostridia bacterium]
MENEQAEALSAERYVYLSFNSKDIDVIRKYAQAMNERLINNWFDETEGEPTSETVAVKAERLKNSALVIFFISKDFVESSLSKGEVTFAQSKNKRCIVVFLNEKAKLDDGLHMQLGHVQSFYPYRRTYFEDAVNELLSGSVFNNYLNGVEDEASSNWNNEDEKTRKRNDRNAKYNKFIAKWGVYFSVPAMALIYYLLIVPEDKWSILGYICILIVANSALFSSVLFRLDGFRRNQKASAKKVKPMLLTPIIVVLSNVFLVLIMLYIKFYVVAK